MKFSILFAVPALVLSSATLSQAQTKSAPLQLSQRTEAPGVALSPGSYTVRIADHLNDRIIVQVQKAGAQSVTTLLAYSNPALANSGSGPVLFSTGLNSKPTLRGFAFSGGPAVEFVYPKGDAVTLAKANDVKVMAVDPASEGRPKLPQLTQSDMSEVTLWMLTPTPVQPGAPAGIQAARYQPPTSAGAVSGTTETASAPQPYRSASPAEPASQPPVQVASTRRPHVRPAVKQLPHTASNLPLIALTGLLSLGLAGGLGAKRRFGANS